MASGDTPASPVEPPVITRTYKCEERDEYLVIATTQELANPKQVTEDKDRDKTFANYDVSGKPSLACSPEVDLTMSSSPNAQEVNPLYIQELGEEWCVVEIEKSRPQGLYGYRYVNYDDDDAEGNIHITDQDL